MTITPEVPTSSRCTIPWRSDAPLVAILNPAAARWPTTVGPVQPGEGCTATPTGLLITTIDGSSWMIWIPSTSSGTTSRGSTSTGIVTSRLAPASTRSLLTAPAPSTCTRPREIRSAARVRESPNIWAMAASTRSPASPSGTGRVRWSACVTTRMHPVGPCCARPGPVQPDPAEGLHEDHHRGHVDTDVGDVEDRPVRQLEEVHDMPLQEARRPDQPVGQVATDPREQQPEGNRPPGAADPEA